MFGVVKTGIGARPATCPAHALDGAQNVAKKECLDAAASEDLFPDGGTHPWLEQNHQHHHQSPAVSHGDGGGGEESESCVDVDGVGAEDENYDIDVEGAGVDVGLGSRGSASRTLVWRKRCRL